MKKAFLAIAIILATAINPRAQQRDYKPLTSGSLVQDRNFYLLTVFQQTEALSNALSKSKTLTTVRARILDSVTKSTTTCEKDRPCLVNSFTLTPEDISEVSTELKALIKKDPAFTAAIRDHLKPSGYFQNMIALPDDALITTAWQQCAEGMNRILDVYGNGKKPLYARIDSVTYNINSDSYKEAIFLWSAQTLREASASTLFFTAPLNFAMALLDINNRDEAARYEPMELSENKAAVQNIATIKWNDYPYTAIIILGAVSAIHDSKLPPIGKLNVRLGAENFRQKLAPLIIVSGGHVHPFRTAKCEAIEMKHELMEKYLIPEANIIIEPHARHTTTNLRNATRLLYKYNIPLDRKLLITTNSNHSRYVETKEFTDRCQKEMGLVPGTVMKRLSTSTLEFLPDIKSLQRYSIDPLDP